MHTLSCGPGEERGWGCRRGHREGERENERKEIFVLRGEEGEGERMVRNVLL
jgi:hypothetical protein